MGKVLPKLTLAILAISWYLFYLLMTPFENLFMLSAPEELYRGAVAKELIEGLKMPLWDYRPDTYNGGFFVITFLTQIFFLLFGYSTFALKLTPLLFSVATLCLWFSILKKYADRFTAVVFTLLYLFISSNFTGSMLSAMGNHPQALLFIALSLWLYLKIIHNAQNNFLILLLGFTLGFGFWFSYTLIFAILTILVHTLIYERSILNKKSIALFILGFLFGISPWIFLILKMPNSTFMINDDPIWAMFLWDYIKEIILSYERFLAKPFLALLLSSTVPRFMSLIFIILTSFIVLYNYSKKLTTLTRIATIFLIISIPVIIFWPVQGMRFYLSITPFFLLLLAIGISQLKKEKHKALSFSSLFFLITLGLLGHTFTLNLQNIGAALRMKGYSYQALGTAENANKFLEKDYIQSKKNLARKDFLELQTSLAISIAEKAVSTSKLNETVKTRNSLPSSLQPYFFYALGQEIFWQSDHSILASKKIMQLKDVEFFNYITLGFLSMAEDIEPESQSLEKFIALEELSQDVHPFYWRAVGTFAYKTGSLEKYLSKLPSKNKIYFLEGVGKYLYYEWQFNKKNQREILKFLNLFPRKDRESLLYGIGIRFAESEVFEFPYAANEYWKKFIQDFSKNELFFILKGRNETLQFFYSLGHE